MNPTANAALSLGKEKKVNAGQQLNTSNLIFSVGNEKKYMNTLQVASFGFDFLENHKLLTSHNLHVETLSTNTDATVSAYHLAYLHERTIANNKAAHYYSFSKNDISNEIVNILLEKNVQPQYLQKRLLQNKIRQKEYLYFTGSSDSR